MYTHPQHFTQEDTLERRKEAGKLLKYLRERAGFTQRAFAARVGTLMWTFISGIETGRNRLPPDQMRVWALAYGVSNREFMLMLMRYYDPETFAMLFEDDEDIFEGKGLPHLAAAGVKTIPITGQSSDHEGGGAAAAPEPEAAPAASVQKTETRPRKRSS